MVTLDKIVKFVNKLRTNKHLQTGIPLIVFLSVGSFGLSEFTRVRYELHKRQGRSLEMEEELKQRKIKKKAPKTLEEIYDETVTEMDTNAWFNIRGPRPGEDSKAIQHEQREQHKRTQEGEKAQT